MLIFRNTGAWGAGKGSRLTSLEVDGNFWYLYQQILALQASLPQPVEISNISQSGSTFTIWLENGDNYTFTLPRAVAETVTANIDPSTGDLTDTNGSYLFQPSLSDAGRYYRVRYPEGAVYQIPTNADVPFLINTEIHFRQVLLNGFIWFTAAPGVTVNGILGFEDVTAQKGAVVTLKKVGVDEWDAFGFLDEATTGTGVGTGGT